MKEENKKYEKRLLLVHGRNLETKYNKDYQGHGEEIRDFYNDEYIPVRDQLLSLTFDEDHRESFDTATEIINGYYGSCDDFSKEYNIKAQSKFMSTFLEVINDYLFKDLQPLRKGSLSIFNKNIYAGLKIDSAGKVGVITKDVDFCIGKSVEAILRDAGNETTEKRIQLNVPVVVVEVKTYLDATMFGEIKSSSRDIRSATPNSKAYVLMGYKDLKDEHIVAARQDSVLTEIFALRADKNSLIDTNSLYAYWKEIRDAVSDIGTNKKIDAPGRLLNR